LLNENLVSEVYFWVKSITSGKTGGDKVNRPRRFKLRPVLCHYYGSLTSSYGKLVLLEQFQLLNAPVMKPSQNKLK
jgi:hypothetical protein